MDHKDYHHYSVENFITDASFIDWVKNPDSPHGKFWETWLAQNPARQKEVEEARQFILYIRFERHHLSAKELAQDHQRLKAAMQSAPSVKSFSHSHFRHWYSVAAVFIGLLTLAFAYSYVLQSPEIVEHTTAYGETKTVVLPDSSVVTLNANSSVKFPAQWKERKVWLQGEAFFEVKELIASDKAGKVKFRVHTDDVTVEVLGTEFNVQQRRGKTAVVLNEGKVKLTANTQAGTGIEMLPGDYAAFSGEQQAFERKQVQAEDYLAWKQNRLIFKNASLEEIATLLEDNYNLKMRFNNPEAANLRYTGTTPADNLGELFTKLSLLFSIKVEREGNQIIVDKL